MIITGGVYTENCARPAWRRIFGSGGRAATAVAGMSAETILHAYIYDGLAESYRLSAAAMGYSVHLVPIKQRIEFEYLHPLSHPVISPVSRRAHPPLVVSGETVLRFDFLEGGAVVKAKRAIYDPQTEGVKKKGFWNNGSTCEELAIVLNEWESLSLTGKPAAEAGFDILDQWKAAVVVIKLGTKGVSVFQKGCAKYDLPAYITSRVFKIGSGDVFSAVFAYCWGERGDSPELAAEYASRAVADYVENRQLPVGQVPSLTDREEYRGQEREPLVYLAGPFFDISQRWLIEECKSSLENLGAQVFSPIHDVGPASRNQDVAEADLRGLEACNVVFAVIDSEDPGTIFEVGYAHRMKKPVVCLAERLPEFKKTMFTGTGCLLFDDLSTALYQTMWASR